MSAKSSTGLNVGGSSILVIFVLLCLTTFATLSMVSANADYKLAQKAAQASSAYYAADARAEEILAEVDGALRTVLFVSVPPEQYLAAQLGSIMGTDITYLPTSPTRGTATYAVPIDDTQSLSVALTLEYPYNGGESRCIVTQWKVVPTMPLDFEDEDSLGLWTGGIPGQPQMP